MRDQQPDSPPFDDDDELTPAELPLTLDAAALRDSLGQLRDCGSLDQLRGAIAALREDLAEGRLHSDSETAVTIRAQYLTEDIDQIAGAQTIERAHYYIDRLTRALGGGKTSPINDINLYRWKEYGDILTDSLWIIDRRDRSSTHSAGYWGNFVPQIPNQMMRRYTKAGEWVLDVFAGSGTTLIEGQRLGRNTIGVELQPQMVEQIAQHTAAAPNPHGVVSQAVQGDSAAIDFRALLEQHGQSAAQLVIMHPPYFDIIKFSDSPHDLSNAASVETFLAQIGQIVENVAPALERGRHLALVIGDKYTKGDWVPLGFQAMNEVLQRGFSLKSIVVKNFDETAGKRTQKELWRYRALVGGFYVFKHEYLFLFKKL